jgi:hypothetical protein
MAIPDQKIMTNIGESRQQLSRSLEEGLNDMAKKIKDASEVQETCTDEWCRAVEHTIDDYATFLFSIHEPRWMSKEHTRKLKNLKQQVHDLYASYKSTAGR